MVNIKNTLSRFKTSARSKTTNIKNGVQKFKENFSEAKNKPRSKRKSLLLGFTTVLSIFGVTLLASVLPAVAKDVPNNTPTSDQVCPSPKPSGEILHGLSGVAATVSALAISSGSFVIGGLCGVIVVVGILKAQGK